MRFLVRCLPLLFCLSAFAADPTTRMVYVRPGGNDAPNHIYGSLSAAENGEDGDITEATGSNEIVIIEIDGDWSGGADTTGTSITGWTTDATHYIEIRTASEARHTGKWDTTKYILSAASGTPLIISEEFVRVIGLQIELTGATANANVLSISTIAAGGSGIEISQSILRTHAEATYTIRVISSSDADLQSLKIWNCVLHHRGLTTANNECYYGNPVATYIANVTTYGGNRGISCISSGAVTYYLRNNLCTETSGADFWFNTGPTYDVAYCVSQDVTADDKAGDGNDVSQTFTFVDAANTDMHLGALDAGAKDLGTSMAGNANIPFTTDIDGVTRSGTWDAGADEYQSATAIWKWIIRPTISD